MANEIIKESVNKVSIVGTLVKNALEIKNLGAENEAIAGKLILRTADTSEHEVNYYANKYKKEDGKFTTQENKVFAGLETVMNDYIGLDDVENESEADVIKIGFGAFQGNDFKDNKDNKIISTSKIKATFANRLTDKEKEITPLEAKFEVSGVITKIEDEIYKENVTGHKIVHLNVIGYNGTLIPVKAKITSEKVEGFSKVGFYEGGTGKLTGNLICTLTKDTVTEKQDFGDDIIREVTFTVKYNNVTGGTMLGDLTSLKLTEELYATCLSKRRLYLDELLNKTKGETPDVVDEPFSTATKPPVSTNPFN